MDTDRVRHQALLAALEAGDWSNVLTAVSLADAWAETALVGDPMLDDVAGTLAELASHQKWEVRRAVANVAAHVDHPAFEPALARLALDDNGRVRQAAHQAKVRRRDSRNASALGKQHAERVNATLDHVEAPIWTDGARSCQACCRTDRGHLRARAVPRSHPPLVAAGHVRGTASWAPLGRANLFTRPCAMRRSA